jgi:DNA processing protein
MSHTLTQHIPELESMKAYPKELFYKGDLTLLKRPKVSIVGSRKISNYTREQLHKLSQALSKRGVCIVSGAAMGADAIAHTGAGSDNTIAVVANGVDIRYPAVNKNLITSIEEKGLVVSQFPEAFRATHWSFVVRNETVVALGELLIIAQADEESGSMRSATFAKKMGKEIWVLPHRLGESSGTQTLLHRGEAQAIYDIEAFASRFGTATKTNIEKDDFFYFCQSNPNYEEAIQKFGAKVYEAELMGTIAVENGIVKLC